MLQNPTSRIYQPTYTGYLSEQMDPQKKSMDNKRTVEGSSFRNPGFIGWGIERPHLRAKSSIITDDMQIAEYPVPKNVLKEIDRHKTGKFTLMDGDRAT